MDELKKRVEALIERAEYAPAEDALLYAEAAVKAAMAMAKLQEISIKEQTRYGKGC